jgi:hypothetical protein
LLNVEVHCSEKETRSGHLILKKKCGVVLPGSFLYVLAVLKLL